MYINEYAFIKLLYAKICTDSEKNNVQILFHIFYSFFHQTMA